MTVTAQETSPPRSIRIRELWILPALELAAIAVLVGVAWLVDSTGLPQDSDSWGYAFAAVVIGFIYGAPVVVLTLLAAVLGSLMPEGRGRLWVARAAAVLCALSGLALAVALVVCFVMEPMAGKVFAVLGMSSVAILLAGAFRAF